jgi:hypothetical protein
VRGATRSTIWHACGAPAGSVTNLNRRLSRTLDTRRSLRCNPQSRWRHFGIRHLEELTFRRGQILCRREVSLAILVMKRRRQDRRTLNHMLDRYALLTNPNVPTGGLKAPTGSCHFATPTHLRVACCHIWRRFPALFWGLREVG